jgi:hypothetical protein
LIHTSSFSAFGSWGSTWLFYLDTDEQSPEAHKYSHSQGALCIDDLLVPEDQQLFGWPILLMDVIALVNQVVLVYADLLYATGLSSLTRGVISMGTAQGADSRIVVVA